MLRLDQQVLLLMQRRLLLKHRRLLLAHDQDRWIVILRASLLGRLELGLESVYFSPQLRDLIVLCRRADRNRRNTSGHLCRAAIAQTEERRVRAMRSERSGGSGAMMRSGSGDWEEKEWTPQKDAQMRMR